AADDVALDQQREDQHWDDGDDPDRGRDVPLDAALHRQQSGGAYRHGLRRLGVDDEQPEQELIPGEDRAQDRRGHQPRAGQRQQHPHQRRPAVAAVQQRRLVDLMADLVEEPAHHPDYQGDIDRNVRQDQPLIGVQQAQIEHHQVDRDRDRHYGHEAVAQDPVREVVARPEAPAREAVGGRGADHQRKQGGGKHHHAGVADVEQEAALVEHLVVVLLDHAPVEDVERGRRLQDLDVGLEGGDHQESERGEDDDQDDCQDDLGEEQVERTAEHHRTTRVSTATRNAVTKAITTATIT